MIALQIIIIFALFFVSGLCEWKKHLHVYAGPEQQSNWDSAFKFCKRKGKNLVTTLDWEAHHQLGHAIHKCGAQCGRHLENSWTAANELDKFKTFVWKGIEKPVDMKMDNWQPGQPDNHKNNEHCVVIWSPERLQRVFLNDRPCNEPYNIICE